MQVYLAGRVEGAPPRELMEGDGGSRAGEAAGRGEMGGGGSSSEGEAWSTML